MTDHHHNSEPKVSLDGSVDPELQRQLEDAAHREQVQGDLSAFASKLVEEGLKEREKHQRNHLI